MRKKLLVLALLMGTLSTYADDYPYLIFETTDGSRTPVEVESLTIQVDMSSLSLLATMASTPMATAISRAD